MHPNLDELLALRDGDGSAETAQHVAHCARCSHELDELCAAAAALRALPRVGVDRDPWPDIRRRVVTRRRRALTVRIGAVAASVLAAVTAVVLTQSGDQPARLEAGAAGARAAVTELEAASRGLEATLRDPALQYQVLSPRRAAVIADLEDRIAVVDMALVERSADWSTAQNIALWSHRVELLDALVAARTGSEDDNGVGYAVFHYEGSQP
jgi:hypothetical protein